MERRDITRELVLSIVGQPDSMIAQDEEIRICSRLVAEKSKLYLYRVFINYLKSPMLVITVYKTSKIEKYGYKI